MERAVDDQRPIAAGGVTVDEKTRRMGRAGQGIRIAPHVAWVYPPGNRIAVAGLTFPLLNLQPEEVIPVQEEAKCHIGEKIMGLRNRDFLPECPVERLEVLRRPRQCGDRRVIRLKLAIEEAPRFPMGRGEKMIAGMPWRASAPALDIGAAQAQIATAGKARHIGVHRRLDTVLTDIAARNGAQQIVEFR